MKARKPLLILSAVLAVLMVIVIIVTYFAVGIFNPINIVQKTQNEIYLKDGFTPGEDTVSEVYVDETEGLTYGTGSMLSDDTLSEKTEEIDKPEETASETTSETTSETQEPVEEEIPAYILEDITRSNRYTLNGELSNGMVEVSVLNEGNQVRLSKKLKAFMEGGDFTIGFLGGSITQGANATTESGRYVNLATDWFAKTFPRSSFTLKNAGIGATGSYIGVHREDTHLLNAKPDIVFIEYAVNDDIGNSVHEAAYESVIRKAWNSANRPAVILLTNVAQVVGTSEYTSNKESNLQIGRFYDLPVLSPGDAILQTCNNEKMVRWLELITESDGVHPTNAGHDVLAKVIEAYVSDVLRKTVADKISGSESNFKDTMLGDRYKDAMLLSPGNTKPTGNNGFTASKDTLQQFEGYWKATKANSSIKFKVTAQNIGVMFLKVSGASEKYKTGKFDVLIDGKKVKSFDTADDLEYPKGEEVLAGLKSAGHTVEIVVTSGELYLQGILLS